MTSRPDEIPPGRLASALGSEGDAVFAALYPELRSIAGAILRSERPGHTLQATAVVHEAWLRLVRSRGLDLSDPLAVRSLVAGVIRRLLVDHARARDGPRRGEGWRRVPLDAGTVSVEDGLAADLLDLEDALSSLAVSQPRQARVVELRFFGGLTQAEAAAAVGVSLGTVEVDWRLAKHWLRQRLVEAGGRPSDG
jgi:RNA polymerase sigma factor (TIGR02999 family)